MAERSSFKEYSMNQLDWILWIIGTGFSKRFRRRNNEMILLFAVQKLAEA